MSKDKKAPKLRFPGFTDAWEQRKFSDIVQVRRGLTYKPTDIQETGIRVLRSSNINDDTFVYGDDDLFVNPNAVNIETVKQNDILITSANGSSRLVGKHALIKDISNKSAVHGGFMLLGRTKNYDFINASMSSSWYTKFINIYVAGGNGSIGNLSKSDLEKQLIFVPSDLEQKKIGLLFSKIDNLITLQQRKLDCLKKYKKGLLQKMFPREGENIPEIRFPEFSGAWEQRELGEFAEKVTKKNSNLDVSETFTNSAEQGIINQNDFFDHKVASTENIGNYYVVEKNDFVYNPRISTTAPVGPINRNRLNRAGVMSPLYTVFRTKDIEHLFLEWYFKSSCWHLFMYLNGDSGARSDRFSIKDSVFFSMPIFVPTKEEQFKIGRFFDQLNKTITLQQRKLDALKMLKKGFLQQMFI